MDQAEVHDDMATTKLREVPTTHTDTDWAEHARTVLQRAGHHRGAARERLIDLMARHDCALSALEIEDALRRGRRGRRGERSVGRASIYRTLELLHGLDLVNRVDVGDGIARYETSDPAGEHHHHHLLCDQCGKLVPFHDPALERSIDQLSSRLGFRTTDHEVTLRGDCPDCS
jgi:Fur family transcriptional regulator, ferric uptake regulator